MGIEDKFGSDYRQFLLDTIPSAKLASGGREVNCRCFYCPDSRDIRHGHFYISIPDKSSDPSTYYCQKCHAAGMVTHKTLLDWGIYSESIAISLVNHNKNVSKTAKNKYLNFSIYNLWNPPSKETENALIKLEYINSRIGTRFTLDDIRNLKICLSLKELMRANHIDKATRDPNIIEQLDANFIGFISIDNAFMNMRRVCDEGLVYKSIDKRYINYQIYDKMDTSQRFYTIPSRLDLETIEPIKIHIAEGPFDILSIYTNLRHGEPGIYTAVGGSNYLGIILYFIESFKLPNVEIHIYPDNDKSGSNGKMKYIYMSKLRPIGIPMYIHRNLSPGQKDFGVAPDHIVEAVQNIEEVLYEDRNRNRGYRGM
jgi:hypothetical protein